MSDEPQRAWVLYHSYHVEGQPLIARVYMDEARAKEDYQLMQNERTINASEWHLEEVPMYGDCM